MYIKRMTTEIGLISDDNKNTKSYKINPIQKIEGFSEDIVSACFLENEDGFITLTTERCIKIWLKKESGLYWPRVSHTMCSYGNTMYFYPNDILFIGYSDGTVTEFLISQDYNSIKMIKNYIAHNGAVTCLDLSPQYKWLFTGGKDKYIECHCTKKASMISYYQCLGHCTALQFDEATQHIFVADSVGQILLLHVLGKELILITTLRGHNNSINSLAWDSERQYLFSGGSDKLIIIWDIGSKKGIFFELVGHQGKINSLVYNNSYAKLLSAGDDSLLISWDMMAKRQVTPMWQESDICDNCKAPFFWNLPAMLEQHVIGSRQHHCRNCGKAVCNKCSNYQTILPYLGYEYNVRICSKCREHLTEREVTSSAVFLNTKHNIITISLSGKKKLLLTAGSDRVIKFWNLSDILKH